MKINITRYPYIPILRRFQNFLKVFSKFPLRGRLKFITSDSNGHPSFIRICWLTVVSAQSDFFFLYNIYFRLRVYFVRSFAAYLYGIYRYNMQTCNRKTTIVIVCEMDLINSAFSRRILPSRPHRVYYKYIFDECFDIASGKWKKK